MTFKRLIVISAFLHGAVFFALGSRLSAEKSHHAETDRWVVDISTLLVSEEPGDTPAPPVPVESKQETVVPPAVEETLPEPYSEGVPPAEPKPASPALLAQAPSAIASSGVDPRAASLQAAFRNTMNNQSIVSFLQAYHRASTRTVSGMVTGTINSDDRIVLDGARGTVVVSFRDGNVAELEILTDNDNLRTLLTAVKWNVVPSPKQYHLPVSRIAYTISLSHGKVGVTASLL